MRSTMKISSLIVCCLFCFSGFATTVYWIGGDGDWEDPDQWDTGIVPESNDDVILSDGEITLHTAALVKTVTVEGSATLIVSSGADLAIDPLNGPMYALDVAGKVAVFGTVRRGGPITTLATLRVNISGYWQTEPGGVVHLELGFINLTGAASNYNNRGELIAENNAFAIQLEGTFINNSTITCIGVSSFTDAIGVKNTGRFFNYGSISMDDFSTGIKNDNWFYNRGSIYMNECDEGIDNRDRFDNTSQGNIEITNSSGFDLISNGLQGRIRNWGNLEVTAAGVFYGIDNSGRIDNYSSGEMTFNGDFDFYVIKNTNDGKMYNYGDLTIGNSSIAANMALDNDGTFINYNSGQLVFTGTYSIYCVRNNLTFDNYGYSAFNGEISNYGLLDNFDCGEMIVTGEVRSFGSSAQWTNGGILRLASSNSFTTSSLSFINNKIIEDPFGNVNLADITNQGVVFQPQSVLYEGLNSGVLAVGDPGAIHLHDEVFDAASGGVVGGFDLESNKFWLSNRAVGLTEIYFFDLECEQWIVLPVTGGVQAAPSPFSGSGTATTNRSIGFRVYPNPAVNTVQLQLPAEMIEEPHFLMLYNSQGQCLVQGQSPLNNDQTIDVANLPAGIYFVDIRNADGTTVNRERLVKQ